MKFFIVLLCGAGLLVAAPPAKNVILFLGDAGGIPTLEAASVHAHNDAQALFIQHMPHIALSDTSAAKDWVTDSAAGMTAIVTGQKTDNGVISETANVDGKPLKTILEYAEEHGLSTGVISNMAITDATPAACYAHASSRKSTADIFAQLLEPKFGDGPDVVIGAGQKEILLSTKLEWPAIQEKLRKAGYSVMNSVDGPAPSGRIAAILDTNDFDPVKAIDLALSILSKNKKGYFLMMEWDMHTEKIRKGLDRVIAMDTVVKRAAEHVGKDTLVMFTADHSFDFRLRGGKKGEEIIQDDPSVPVPAKPKIRVETGHTGEQVLVAAQGPGSEKIQGFLRNTDLFGVMMYAFGWAAR